MTYCVYEYPDGYGYISIQETDNTDCVLRAKCKSIKEAKEVLKGIISDNHVKGKLKRR